MDIYSIRTQLHAGKSIYDIPLRVTYYARVSTDKDEQLHSLAAQVRYYTQFIQGCSAWTFTQGYIDEGTSGTSVGKRESFLRMLADAQAGMFDFIITKEISRFSRNTLDSIHYTQELLRSGVGVLFQSDNINTLMPDAELRLTIMSSIAQDEVRKISERVRFGFKRAIEHGVVLGNDRIWGYEKQNGALVIKDDEAAMVRLIFDLYANQKLGIRAVADHLTQLGYRNSNGNPFSFSTIRGILTNPKYKGYYCGGKSCKYDYKLNQRKHFSENEWIVYKDEDHVPPIVTEALWEKANALLCRRSQSQKAQNPTTYQNRYSYSGKLYCTIHQQPFYRSIYRYKNTEKEVWQCRVYTEKGRCGCTLPVLYTAELDNVVSQILRSITCLKTEISQKLIRIYLTIIESADINRSVTRMKAEIEDILKRMDKLLDLSMHRYISDEEFAIRNQRFNLELKTKRQALSILERECVQEKEIANRGKNLENSILNELKLEQGYSSGVIDALVERVDIAEKTQEGLIPVCIHLNSNSNCVRFLIKRNRGKPSVCSRQNI